MEQFRILSEWYHIPIMELTELDDFDFCPQTVAQRLGIPATLAEVPAIYRLERLGLIRIDDKGKYCKVHKTASSNRNMHMRVYENFIVG